MIIMLSGPNKRTGFSNKIKQILNRELKNCSSLVAIASSKSFEKNDRYFNGDDNALGVKGMIKQLDIKIKNYYLIDNRTKEKEMVDMIEKSDIIYLMGGDPFVQLQLIKKIDYKNLFRNKVLIGVSAGSMNLGKTSYYSKDDDYPVTQFYDGLGMIDITIDPHFDIENEIQVSEAKKFSFEHEIIGLPNESAIIIIGDNIKYIGDYYVIDNGNLNPQNGNL